MIIFGLCCSCWLFSSNYRYHRQRVANCDIKCFWNGWKSMDMATVKLSNTKRDTFQRQWQSSLERNCNSKMNIDVNPFLTNHSNSNVHCYYHNLISIKESANCSIHKWYSWRCKVCSSWGSLPSKNRVFWFLSFSFSLKSSLIFSAFLRSRFRDNVFARQSGCWVLRCQTKSRWRYTLLNDIIILENILLMEILYRNSIDFPFFKQMTEYPTESKWISQWHIRIPLWSIEWTVFHQLESNGMWVETCE